MKKLLSLSLIGILAILMAGCSINVSIDTPADEKNLIETPAEQQTPQVKQNTPSTPQVHTAENLLEKMSQSEKTEVNKFLSNFSEAFYGRYYSGAEAKIHFAFIHSLINSDSSTIKYEDMEMGISASETDTILNRFFGSTIPHKTPDGSKDITYKNGYFMMPAASGESYAYFSVASDMQKRSDGNFLVKFSVFFDAENAQDMLQSWYSLSYDEAVSNPQYSHEYNGEAILKQKGSTYEIVSYTTF
ncbi:MAG: hypothetical protein IKA17_10050 [Clostridia bacterium]|nr:hypothetical protein [Clostridia bacterium]